MVSYRKFDTGVSADYPLKAKDNGVYTFILSGDVTINNQQLTTREGFGDGLLKNYLSNPIQIRNSVDGSPMTI